ncbi:MAG TPA: MBL fold metallo-hydrolase [Galbitalea sp.]|jgi:glyoxylase-like metal-dependent hydrolase (beta-lactamase superfamily II)|nr:MBL fold metallo-hydrolase [Galbitalea sp.]
MLKQEADGVLVHQSEFMQSNAVVVHGEAGVLLVDPGICRDELAGLAMDLSESGQSVVVGFSTHPHWDHLLWHAALGRPPRYGTALCAAAVQARLSDTEWKAGIAGMIPPDILEQVPLDDLFGRITGLPAEATQIPWDGPVVRIIEHQAHAPGHAALLIEERGLLIAGDMLSDILIPMPNMFAPEPIEDYLAGLELLEAVADDVKVLIPGHGSIGDTGDLHARIGQDRAFVLALREGQGSSDPRLALSAAFGAEMSGVRDWQVQQFAERRKAGGTS